ncbi:MAG: serine hydrolase domain-containing protein [Vicinamibacterales bacterium]
MHGRAREVLAAAVAARAFPAAVAEVGSRTEVRWREAFGSLTYDRGAPAATLDTPFDLASLTKVLATTLCAMQCVDGGALHLDDRVSAHLPEWALQDRQSVTVEDLLTHCSGLPAYLPFFRMLRGTGPVTSAIASTPFAYAPRTASLYSDLGFILLGTLLERLRSRSLADQFRSLARALAVGDSIGFHPPRSMTPVIAPTEQDPWRGRLLAGEVHDENAWAMGGVAGHAGLFGTAEAVGVIARHLLQILDGRAGLFSGDTTARFTARRREIPGSSRAVGWDTMLPTSSCGGRMSGTAFGHTGFTGTSLWLDPERGLYAVLLTNRVHPTRSNDAITRVRPAFHDAVWSSAGRS